MEQKPLWELQIFGNIRLRRAMVEVELPPGKLQEILVYLALQQGKEVLRKTIIDDIWPEEDQDGKGVGVQGNVICEQKQNAKKIKSIKNVSFKTKNNTGTRRRIL